MGLMIMVVLSITIMAVLSSISKMVSESKMEKKEISTNFECGFNPQTEKNVFLSSQFFMIAMLFIIFDMEIALVIPILKSNYTTSKMSWNIMTIMMILLLGTMVEWKLGLIEWAK